MPWGLPQRGKPGLEAPGVVTLQQRYWPRQRCPTAPDTSHSQRVNPLQSENQRVFGTQDEVGCLHVGAEDGGWGSGWRVGVQGRGGAKSRHPET